MNRFQRILFLTGLFFVSHLSTLSTAHAAYELISRDLKELAAPGATAIELFSRSDLSGITLVKDAYFLTTVDGFLEKRSLQYHSVLWQTKLLAPSQSSWTVDQDQLFGGDTKGYFYSVDAKSGKILWKTPTKGVFFSKPLIVGNQVFVVTSHGVLQSYDRSSGQWLWQQSDPGTGSLGLWSQQGPVNFQGYIVTGFPSATLVAYSPQDGKPIWNESFADKLQPGDSFNDLKAIHSTSEMLFASSFSGDLKAWEAVQGSKKLLWEKRLSLHAPMTLDGSDGTLYFSARDGKVYAVDAKTGFIKWDFVLSRGLGTQPSVGPHGVWVGTSTGTVVVLSKEGKLLARSNDYQSPLWNPLVLLDGDEAFAITGRALMRWLHLAKTTSSN